MISQSFARSHHFRSITTSRYSLGSTSVRSPERLRLAMLTSAAMVVDRIVGLEMGADDYVPKPFDPRELLARVKSVLRRTSSAGRADLGAARVRIGRCVLDLAAHRLMDEKGTDVAMSPLEFDLLKALAEHPNRALSRERILNLNQQRDWDPFDRSVDLRIMRVSAESGGTSRITRLAVC